MTARVALALAFAVTYCSAMNVEQRSTFLRPSNSSVVQPLEFNQRLLVCNAYPSESLVTVKHNGHAVFDEDSHGVGYKACRYVSNRVLAKDKLDFAVETTGTEGTFEVGDLPATDALLLLVISHDVKSPLIRFQSFAFPTGNDNQDAQLAVIDAFKGTNAGPHLRMEDHVTGKDAKKAEKRVEQLNFDRVYAIQEGSYDTLVMDRHNATTDEQMEAGTKRIVNLHRNNNYVVLRVGDDKHFPQSLVVFPEERSASAPLARTWLAVVVALVCGWMA